MWEIVLFQHTLPRAFCIILFILKLGLKFTRKVLCYPQRFSRLRHCLVGLSLALPSDSIFQNLRLLLP